MEIVHGNDYSELGYKVMKHRATAPLHWHKNFELCEIAEGPCNLLVDGQSFEGNKGDIVTIREKDVHGFFVNEQVSFKIVQFSSQIFLNNNFKISPLKTHIKAEEIDSIPGLREKINHLFAALEMESGMYEVKDNPFFALLCESLYFLLMRYFSVNKEKKTHFDRETFFEVIEYINNHYMEDVNINIVAERMGISRNRLARMFELHAGKTLKEYIDMLRIDRANRMMSQGCNVTEAATASGYQCIRTFNNIYKTYMGITPSEYIRQYVKKQNKEGETQ